MKTRLTFGVLLAVIGCKEPAKPTHTGFYIFGQNSLNAYVRCGERDWYWVTGPGGDALENRARRLARVPGQPVYVEFIGAMMPETEPVPPGYKGAIRVDTMLPAQPTPPPGCGLDYSP